MEQIQRVDFDYFARWYLRREMREKWRLPAPDFPAARMLWMKLWHAGKIVPWFIDGARWSVCRLTTLSELENLLVLSSRWTRRQGLVVSDEPRLLGHVARRAQKSHFRDLPHDNLGQFVRRVGWVRRFRLGRWFPSYVTSACPRLLAYYHRHQLGLPLDGINGIVLRSLSENERAELLRAGVANVPYYLHDGFGRMLSYMALLQQKIVPFQPVTAIVADRQGIAS